MTTTDAASPTPDARSEFNGSGMGFLYGVFFGVTAYLVADGWDRFHMPSLLSIEGVGMLFIVGTMAMVYTLVFLVPILPPYDSWSAWKSRLAVIAGLWMGIWLFGRPINQYLL